MLKPLTRINMTLRSRSYLYIKLNFIFIIWGQGYIYASRSRLYLCLEVKVIFMPFTPKKVWTGSRVWTHTKLKTKINSEFNFIHFGIKINKRLKLSTLEICLGLEISDFMKIFKKFFLKKILKKFSKSFLIFFLHY